jgi:hypothetical protein
LFEATGLFDIKPAANGQSYVADKRNKDRTAAPAGGRGETLSDRLPAPINAGPRQ